MAKPKPAERPAEPAPFTLPDLANSRGETIERADGTILGVVRGIEDMPSMKALAEADSVAHRTMPLVEKRNGGTINVEEADLLDQLMDELFALVFDARPLPEGTTPISIIEREIIATRFFVRLPQMQRHSKPRAAEPRAAASSTSKK